MAEEGCGPRGVKTKIIRVMPNTPAMVGAGMSALCRNEYVTEEEFEFVMKIFSGIGSAEEVEESFMVAGDRQYPEAALPTSICLSKRWPTEECLQGFRGRKRLNSRRRPFWGAPGWFWRRGGIPGS